mmetsp:Transcript_25110/g.73572  ORF Transcript_25110/g.73572 Transcript_25110/m.73572 type:complete len:362 (-) Transcript_25110:846-1931(-)
MTSGGRFGTVPPGPGGTPHMDCTNDSANARLSWVVAVVVVVVPFSPSNCFDTTSSINAPTISSASSRSCPPPPPPLFERYPHTDGHAEWTRGCTTDEVDANAPAKDDAFEGVKTGRSNGAGNGSDVEGDSDWIRIASPICSGVHCPKIFSIADDAPSSSSPPPSMRELSGRRRSNRGTTTFSAAWRPLLPTADTVLPLPLPCFLDDRRRCCFCCCGGKNDPMSSAMPNDADSLIHDLYLYRSTRSDAYPSTTDCGTSSPRRVPLRTTESIPNSRPNLQSLSSDPPFFLCPPLPVTGEEKVVLLRSSALTNAAGEERPPSSAASASASSDCSAAMAPMTVVPSGNFVVIASWRNPDRHPPYP